MRTLLYLRPHSFVRDSQLKTTWYHKTKKCYPRARKILAEKIPARTCRQTQKHARRSCRALCSPLALFLFTQIPPLRSGSPIDLTIDQSPRRICARALLMVAPSWFLLFLLREFISMLLDYSSSVKVMPRSLSRIIPVRRM
jgi:hypothetical protein